jgi:uncharacterized Zn-finger protein
VYGERDYVYMYVCVYIYYVYIVCILFSRCDRSGPPGTLDVVSDRVISLDIEVTMKIAITDVTTVVKEKHHKCTVAECDYSTDKESVITRYKRTHTGEKPHKCDFAGCTYVCSRKSHLNTHKMSHTGEKPHKCDFTGCEYVCARKGHLTRHQMTHTGEKPYKCDFTGCGYVCARRKCDGLTRHKRTHTGEKPYNCAFTGCEYACTTSGSLTLHKRAHTGEKPYNCDFMGCEYATSQKSNLTVHKRIHTGEKPYPCEECDLRFTTSHHRRSHETYHEKSNSWTVICPYDSFATTKAEGMPCAKRFPHERALDFHIQTSHTVDGLQNRLQSELRMAEWFDSQDIKYDRDFTNVIRHARCPVSRSTSLDSILGRTSTSATCRCRT